jgi:DNA-binding transcriptional MerR regulator
VIAASAPLRMKDLCAQTGLSRQAIHFYIQQGVVPEGRKTGRNMAWYGPEHVERLLLVRRLQEERFLPLKAIRALLGGDAGHLAETQRALLLEVRSRLPQRLTGDDPVELIPLDVAAASHGVSAADAARLVELGLIAVREQGGRRELSSSSSWVLELWGRFRAAGFTPELGFGPDDLLIFDEAVDAMFQRETQLVTERIAGLSPERVAEMVQRALPIIHAFINHLHGAAVRGFFAALGATAAAPPSASPRQEPT